MDGERRRKPQIRWNDEREQFLRDHYPTTELKPLTEEFNRRFGHALTPGAVGQKIHEIGIKKRPCA